MTLRTGRERQSIPGWGGPRRVCPAHRWKRMFQLRVGTHLRACSQGLVTPEGTVVFPGGLLWALEGSFGPLFCPVSMLVELEAPEEAIL